MSALHALATLAGLDPGYVDWRGDPVVASDDSIRAALAALGTELPEDGVEEAARHAIAGLERARWREIVPPVVIGWEGALVIPFAVPADQDGSWELEILTEAGRRVVARGRLFELGADSHAWPGGAVHCVRRAHLGLDGETGYHRVSWRASWAGGGGQGEALGISAPLRAWGAPGEGPRRWGVFAPVYGLASPATGEAGDLSTLRALFEAVARRGGRYVGALPILAASLDEPYHFSPYSPISRHFWNEVYLDLRALAADAGLPADAVPAPARHEPDALIDFRGHYLRRRAVLEPIARALLAAPARRAEIDAWAAAAGAYDYAAFRALGEVSRQSWHAWPAEWRDGTALAASREAALALGAEADRVDVHVVAQWAMGRQLAALAGGPVSLYLDLPVGVSSDAYEVWRHRELFVTKLSVGAPPDALFLGGQSWGLPPLSPQAQRRDEYRYFRRCVRHHMSVAGMLRVDHVMGLFRVYCVPRRRPATDGVYLRYPVEELFAILTLESHRARCAVAGEDLGTVPADVRPMMTRHGMYRLHVGQWSLPAKPGDAPEPSPAPAVASLNTHDTPTFAGWWRGVDIADRRDLGLTTEAQEAAERVERAQQREALLAFAAAREAVAGLAGDRAAALDDTARAMVAATADLAEGPAEVLLVALDDLALDPIAHNVPGTVHERPNWRRRIAGWSDALDEERAPAAAAAAIAAILAARS
jgi:4-alpha-glucanotransferase